LRAEGSPKKLMQDMGASVVEVGGPLLRNIKQKIVGLSEVRSAAQQGMRLRVLVDKKIDDPEGWLKQQLANNELEFNHAHPSLEDVFVLVTGSGRKAAEEKR